MGIKVINDTSMSVNV